ncbi:MAG: hypothetical protein ABIG73_02120 [Patescibacteria group bacterium]
MPEITREEKLKLVEKLPQRLQEFLYSEDTGAALLYLGQKYNLTDEKVRLLSKLTGDVVLGITPIASLAQEINSNILPDPQTAMTLAQELYTDVLAPALTPSTAPTASPSASSLVSVPVTTPRPAAAPSASKAESPTPSADRYREPATGSPEVVDLRNQPKAGPPRAEAPSIPTPIPVAPKPVPIAPKPMPPAVSKVEPPPLIEAEPHKAPAPISVPVPAPLSEMPQIILRPPGLPPTGSSRDILDLRKDKGEFQCNIKCHNSLTWKIE